MAQSLKVVLLGDSGVGKTCISNRLLSDDYNPSEAPTIGGVYGTKTITHGNENFELLVWDTAGQEMYRGLAPMYYRNSQIAIIVFDITDKKSFGGVEYWMNELHLNIGDSIIIMICGNKCDRDDSRAVDSNEAQNFASTRKALYTETSALTGDGIERLFQTVTAEYVRRMEEIQKDDDKQSIDVTNSVSVETRKKSCC